MPTEAAGDAAILRWTSCPPDPLPWIGLRELLLHVLHQPALLLPAAALLGVALARALRCSRPRALLLGLLLPVVLSALYSPAGTLALESWLAVQRPRLSPGAAYSSPPVAVIPGRGPLMAAATTARAAELVREQRVQLVYVSGDDRGTADQLLHLGVPITRVAGDSCARTTWENAALTARWLHREASGSGVLPAVWLITDPWQLPRATRAFQRQGLRVIPDAVAPTVSPSLRNRLALREAAAMLLYGVQGRL